MIMESSPIKCHICGRTTYTRDGKTKDVKCTECEKKDKHG